MRSQNEFSLVTINGLMHHYLDESWIVMGQSRIGIYHDTTINTFRIVGRKMDDFEVVANCAINESFCYNKATTTFHQWRDIIDDRVYGVKFASIDDANLFGETIEKIVESAEKMANMIAQAKGNVNYNNNNINRETGNDQNGTINNNKHFQQHQPQHQQTSCELLTRFQTQQQQQQQVNDQNTDTNDCLDEIDYGQSTTDHHNGAINSMQNDDHHQSDHVINHQTQPQQEQQYYGSKLQDGKSNGFQHPQQQQQQPPPPPPPLPPHLKPIGIKPKISVKPEFILNGNRNHNPMTVQQQQQQQPLRSSTMNIPGIVTNNNSNGSNNNNNNNSNKVNLIDEMAQTLAKRRAKIEESCQQNDQIKTEFQAEIPLPPSHNNKGNVKCYTPINSNIRRFNSVSNGSSTHHSQFLNGGSAINLQSNNNNSNKSSSLNMINQKVNSQSLINISNSKSSTINGQQSPSTSTSNSSVHQDRLKEEILQEIRQELLRFKQDLLNAIRVEILANLEK